MAKPKPLRSILEESLKSLGVHAPMKVYSIWGAWRGIVGDSLASHAQPSAVRNRILFIDVSHPTWMQQLQFLKPTLLEKLNHFLGEPLLQDIRFRSGKISSSVSPPPGTPTWEEQEVDRETVERIDGLLQEVADSEVRENLRDVLIKGAKVDRYRKKTRTGRPS